MLARGGSAVAGIIRQAPASLRRAVIVAGRAERFVDLRVRRADDVNHLGQALEGDPREVVVDGRQPAGYLRDELDDGRATDGNGHRLDAVAGGRVGRPAVDVNLVEHRADDVEG